MRRTGEGKGCRPDLREHFGNSKGLSQIRGCRTTLHHSRQGAEEGGGLALGWMAPFMIGITLAAGYALYGLALPGPGWVRGALFGIGPFLMTQIAVMSIMGMPFFSGSAAMAMGILVGHLVYGGVVGGVYGEAAEARPVPAMS